MTSGHLLLFTVLFVTWVPSNRKQSHYELEAGISTSGKERKQELVKSRVQEPTSTGDSRLVVNIAISYTCSWCAHTPHTPHLHLGQVHREASFRYSTFQPLSNPSNEDKTKPGARNPKPTTRASNHPPWLEKPHHATR